MCTLCASTPLPCICTCPYVRTCLRTKHRTALQAHAHMCNTTCASTDVYIAPRASTQMRIVRCVRRTRAHQSIPTDDLCISICYFWIEHSKRRNDQQAEWPTGKAPPRRDVDATRSTPTRDRRTGSEQIHTDTKSGKTCGQKSMRHHQGSFSLSASEAGLLRAGIFSSSVIFRFSPSFKFASSARYSSPVANSSFITMNSSFFKST